MKVIFLDIDGVLNSAQSAHMYHVEWIEAGKPIGRQALREDEICPIAISNLRYVLEKCPEVHIVVSSTWRLGRSVEELKDLLFKWGIAKERVVGRTPALYVPHGERHAPNDIWPEGFQPTRELPRGLEIQDWLDKHPEVTKFAIIDDDSDMEHLMPFLFHTNYLNGLMFDTTLKLISFFTDPVPATPESI